MSAFSFNYDAEMSKSYFHLGRCFLKLANVRPSFVTAASALKAIECYHPLTSPSVVNIGASTDATNVEALHGVMKHQLQPCVSVFTAIAAHNLIEKAITTAGRSTFRRALSPQSYQQKSGHVIVVVKPLPKPKPVSVPPLALYKTAN
jgi:hypothetical protein